MQLVVRNITTFAFTYRLTINITYIKPNNL